MTDALHEAAALLSVMGHPARLRVLHALHREGPLTAGALQLRAGLEASALSHQLRILRDAHLVRVVPSGRHRIYALDDPHVARLVEDALAHVEHTVEPDAVRGRPSAPAEVSASRTR
jgi:DNA-binding transcriptional ArsR family regulator